MSEQLQIKLSKEPVSTTIVFVFSDEGKSGTSHVAKSIQALYPIAKVQDLGAKAPSIEAIDHDDQVIFVTERNKAIPDYVIELSNKTQVDFIFYSETYYDETEWKLMQTNHELLKALELLLPADHPVRLKRDAIRAGADTSPQQIDVAPNLAEAFQ